MKTSIAGAAFATAGGCSSFASASAAGKGNANDAKLNIFEKLLLNRVSYQRNDDEYSLRLKKISSKIAEFDNSKNEWK